MNSFFLNKFVPFIFYRSTKKRPIFKSISSHILMIFLVFIQIMNLSILKSIGLEPWILLTCRCFGGLMLASIFSILSLIRDPIPFDKGTLISSFSYSIGQLFALANYYIHGSVDGEKDYCSMILLSIFLIFGSIHEFKHIASNNCNSTQLKLNLLLILTAICSTLFSFPSIIKFEYLRNSPQNLLVWAFIILIYIFCKLFYYFGMIRVDHTKVRVFEVSATNISNISKLGIPFGIFMHAYRMKMLLPGRKFTSFLLDFTRFDNQTLLYVFLSSFISFGIVLPLQVLLLNQISLMEYTLYSIAPNIILSKSFLGIGFFVFAIMIQIYKDTNESFKSFSEM